MSQCALQELYILDTCTLSLQRLPRSTAPVTHHFPEISFSSESKLFLAVWYPIADSPLTANQYFEVYSCSGQRLSSFQDPDAEFEPPVAHLSGNRAAIAHVTTFGLWNLETGQLMGTAGPGLAFNDVDPHNGLIAANSASSKLAFCPSQYSSLFIYDSVSLELLSTLLPVAGCASVILAARAAETFGLVWGPYGWLVVYSAYQAAGQTERPLELLQPQAGGSSYKAVRVLQSGPIEMLAASSYSPCGAYFCSCEKHMPTIQMHDVRSGRLVFRRIVRPEVRGKPKYDASMH